MAQVRSAGAGSAVLVRASRSLLLAAALVCASALRPAVRPAGATPLRSTSGRIAFEKGGEIYVMDMNSGLTAKLVDNSNNVFNMQPALSPDASRVAFSSNRDGKFSIYIIGVDGQGLRRVTHNPADDSEPAWSPDGSRLAFVRGFDATGSGVVVLSCNGGPGSSDILTVSADAGGEGERPVEVNLTHDAGGGTDPAWSPDGKRIAFASDREGDFNIYTMSSDDGGYVERLTEDTSAEADPAWSPDGSSIAYTGMLREDRTQQCGNMPIIGDGDEENTFAEEANVGGTGSFLGGDGPYVYRMTAGGNQHQNLTVAGIAAEPAWSPDGSHIIFAGKRKGEDVDLYLITSEGTGHWIQFTFDPAQDKSPSWAGTVTR